MLLRLLILHHLFKLVLPEDLATIFLDVIMKMNEEKSKVAYDIKCKAKCKTRSLADFQKHGTVVNTSIHGYEFDKPCKFPFQINDQMFHGCVWSDSHDSVGPWCYTETKDKLEQTERKGNKTKFKIRPNEGKPKKWGICSDDCPVEDCPPCESSVDGKQDGDNCTREGWDFNRFNGVHYGAPLWCYHNKDKGKWKFCSNKCENNSNLINSECKNTFKPGGATYPLQHSHNT